MTQVVRHGAQLAHKTAPDVSSGDTTVADPPPSLVVSTTPATPHARLSAATHQTRHHARHHAAHHQPVDGPGSGGPGGQPGHDVADDQGTAPVDPAVDTTGEQWRLLAPRTRPRRRRRPPLQRERLRAGRPRRRRRPGRHGDGSDQGDQGSTATARTRATRAPTATRATRAPPATRRTQGGDGLGWFGGHGHGHGHGRRRPAPRLGLLAPRQSRPHRLRPPRRAWPTPPARRRTRRRRTTDAAVARPARVRSPSARRTASSTL